MTLELGFLDERAAMMQSCLNALVGLFGLSLVGQAGPKAL
jgi:hypothetical protein